MSEIIKLFFSFIAVYILPIVTGEAILKNRASLISKWWLGLVLIATYLLICHSLNINQSLVFIFFSFFIIAQVIFLGFKYIKQWKLFKGKKLYFYLISFFNFSCEFLFSFSPSIIVLLCGYVSILSSPVSISDAVSIWFNKIKGLYYWVPLKNISFPTYPNLLPIYEMLIIKSTGGLNESYGRLIFPTIYFFFTITLLELSGKRDKFWQKFFASLIAVSFYKNFFFTSGYMDGGVAIFTAVSSIYFLKLLNGPIKESKASCFVSFILAGSIGLIKLEGSTLGLILVFSLIFCHLFSGGIEKIKTIFPYLFLFFLFFSLWHILLKINNISLWPIQGVFAKEDILNIIKNLNRLPVISQFLIDDLKENFLLIFFSLFFSFIIVIFKPKMIFQILFLWGIIVFHILFVIVTFLLTKTPLRWHLETAFSRLMFQHYYIYAVLAYFCIISLISELKKEKTLPKTFNLKN